MAYVDPIKQKQFVDLGLGSALDYTGSEEQNADIFKVSTQSLPNTSIINSENTQPNPEIPFQTPKETPIPPIPPITPPLQETPSEAQAQSLTNRLQLLNDALVGQSEYKGQQETQQGIPELVKTKNDLTARLNILKNEALAIPQQLQVEATGRGITAGGLRPLETARLRTNAIQALGVSALLEAANGNLTTAQSLVDRAVAAKFDPIKEEIAVKTANLDLILKSPDYTREEKNRAQAQLDAQNKKLEEAKKAEEEQKKIWDIATTAAQNGADSMVLEKIQKATTKQEALKIATDNNVLTKPLTEGDRLDLELKKLQIQKARLDLTPKKEPGKIVKINGVDYIQDEEGNLSIPNVPKGEIDTAEEEKTISTIDSLLAKGSGILEAVGPHGLARAGFGRLTGKTSGFIASIDQIVSQLSLEKLIEAKKQGATFGALTDREMRILASSATKIGTWELRDEKTNKVIGYNVDEPTFRKELQVIKDMAQKDKDRKMGKVLIDNYLDNSVLPTLNSTENAYYSAGYLQQ